MSKLKKFNERKFINEQDAIDYAQVNVDRGLPVSISHGEEGELIVRVWQWRTA